MCKCDYSELSSLGGGDYNGVVIIIITHFCKLTFTICQAYSNLLTFAPDHIFVYSCLWAFVVPLKQASKWRRWCTNCVKSSCQETITPDSQFSTRKENTTGHYHFQLWPSRDSLSHFFLFFFVTFYSFPHRQCILKLWFVIFCDLKLWLKIFFEFTCAQLCK